MPPGPVLVVEDQEDLRETLCELIREEGLRVHAVRTAAEGMDYLLKGERPCLVVTDLLLPGLSGRDLIAWVDGQAQLASIDVVVITASNACRDEGDPIHTHPRVRRCVSKPFELTDLLPEIARSC